MDFPHNEWIPKIMSFLMIQYGKPILFNFAYFFTLKTWRFVTLVETLAFIDSRANSAANSSDVPL
jgi:hypothetical protein